MSPWDTATPVFFPPDRPWASWLATTVTSGSATARAAWRAGL